MCGRVWVNVVPILVSGPSEPGEIGDDSTELIKFNYLRCHSSSTALGTRTGYWKPTGRGTYDTPHNWWNLCLWNFLFQEAIVARGKMQNFLKASRLLAVPPWSRDIHIECSKQFKWNSYFYVSGQSRPFWAALKLF